MDLDIDDINDEEPLFLKNIKTEVSTIFDDIQCGENIRYDFNSKKFAPFYSKSLGVHVGQFLNRTQNCCDILYKGFLLKDPIEISSNINDYYMPIYIRKEFEKVRDSIISLMPRVKRLKRLNLKMITRQHALIIYNNLNEFTDKYAYVFGDSPAQIFKANLVTTPFYINDNGMIKLYSIETNELKELDIETAGNFLAYFTFQYK